MVMFAHKVNIGHAPERTLEESALPMYICHYERVSGLKIREPEFESHHPQDGSQAL